ncbi:MAG: 6-carboxytetrahydropterin synthase [Lachnospiraceae bacterium]|nr:6-carboxytetrahydropterin synthase [Lachnospiraceae bacterium]
MEKTYKQYKFKFYLNMNHFIYNNGHPGEVHPHTWELTLSVISNNSEMTPFFNLEHKVEQLMDKYQDKLLNDCEPFNEMIPTVENAARYFFRMIQDAIMQEGWILLMLELSETPTRSYVINAVLDEDSIWSDWQNYLTAQKDI